MSKKRIIDTSFWSDPWIVDELNPLDRYLMLYFLSNEKTNVAGVYEISLRTMANETGIEKDEIIRMLKRLESRVIYDDGWIVLRNAIKHQNYKNEKIKQGIELALSKCPPVHLLYLKLPNDWIPLVVKKETENLQIKLDVPPMSLEESSHPNSNSNFNNNSTNVELAKPQTYGREDINELFNYWSEVVGYKISAQTQNNRRAAYNLIRKHGLITVKLYVDGIAKGLDDRFAPRISNFIALQARWDELTAWGIKGVKEQGRSSVVVVP